MQSTLTEEVKVEAQRGHPQEQEKGCCLFKSFFFFYT